MSIKQRNSGISRKKVNIFLCHNPFHVYICNQICINEFTNSDFDNYIICSISQFNRLKDLSYILVGKGLIRRVISYWKAKIKINNLSNWYREDAQFFIPHIGGVLGNYIFESKVLSRNSSRINFYYEGAVMIDKRRKERAIQIFAGQKTILSLLMLHRFVKHTDILPMNSPRIHKVYTPYPEKTQAEESKKELVTFPRHNINRGLGGILVVGVDAGDALVEATVRLIHYIRNLQNKSTARSVYFKPHYADRLKVFEKEAKKVGFDYKMVIDSRCIEEIIGDLDVETIICTHFSSALLNLKLLYRNDLKVIFLAHPKAIGVLGKEYVEMILSVGVEVIELKEWSRNDLTD